MKRWVVTLQIHEPLYGLLGPEVAAPLVLARRRTARAARAEWERLAAIVGPSEVVTIGWGRL